MANAPREHLSLPHNVPASCSHPHPGQRRIVSTTLTPTPTHTHTHTHTHIPLPWQVCTHKPMPTPSKKAHSPTWEAQRGLVSRAAACGDALHADRGDFAARGDFAIGEDLRAWGRLGEDLRCAELRPDDRPLLENEPLLDPKC
jgi:hypothetical protein